MWGTPWLALEGGQEPGSLRLALGYQKGVGRSQNGTQRQPRGLWSRPGCGIMVDMRQAKPKLSLDPREGAYRNHSNMEEMPKPPAWSKLAHCWDRDTGLPLDVFLRAERLLEGGNQHAPKHPDVVEAKWICHGCPVREECLEFTLTNEVRAGRHRPAPAPSEERAGVAGGMTPVERTQNARPCKYGHIGQWVRKPTQWRCRQCDRGQAKARRALSEVSVLQSQQSTREGP